MTLAAEAAPPPGANGLVMLPYFSGERTPIHDTDAKGVIFGLNLTHTRGDIYRALFEGIACARSTCSRPTTRPASARGDLRGGRGNAEPGLGAGHLRCFGAQR